MPRPQRCSSAATRPAKSRSGVTRAALALGSSMASLRNSAMARASCSGEVASASLRPCRAKGCGGATAIAPTGRCAALRAQWRSKSRRSSQPGHSATSRGLWPRVLSRAWRPNWGWLGAVPTKSQVSISKCPSRPGKMIWPLGRVRRVLARAATAGMVAVVPARMMGWVGGLSCQAAACSSSKRRRRAAGEMRPASASIAGQASCTRAIKRAACSQNPAKSGFSGAS